MKLHPNQNVDESFKPSQKGVILSTTSIIDVQERLLNKHKDKKYFMPGKADCDYIEGYNSCHRIKGPTPTPKTYMQNAKAIGLTQYLGPLSGGNYETPDTDKFLVQLKHFKEFKRLIQNDDIEKKIKAEKRPRVKLFHLNILKLKRIP